MSTPATVDNPGREGAHPPALRTPPALGPGRPPSRPLSAFRGFARASVSRGYIEILQLFRRKDAVVFTVALPVVMLGLFASIFSGLVPGTNVHYSQLYTTGLLTGGLASTSFLNLAVSVATERENGGLKRLAGTPMPRTAFFLGKAIVVIVVCTLEVTILLLIGHFVYNVAFPSTLDRWWTFIWVTVLGALAMSLIGIALSGVPRSARSAVPVANLPLLVLEFISGIFIPFTSLPSGLYSFSGIFPLRWVAEGYRSALLPSYFQRVEPGHVWDRWDVALVLAAWCVVSLAVTAKTFKWTNRGE